MHLKNGDKEVSLENYNKAVELNPNNVKAKKKIEELLGESK
jgi:hypothetical protein